MECEIRRERVIFSLLQFEVNALLLDLEKVKNPDQVTEAIYKRLLTFRGKKK